MANIELLRSKWSTIISIMRGLLNLKMGMLTIVPFLPMVYLFLYVGVLLDPNAYIKNLKVGLLVHDEGFSDWDSFEGVLSNVTIDALNDQDPIRASDALEYILKEVEPAASVLDWKFYPKDTTRDQLQYDISQGDIWGGLYIPPNYSMQLFKPMPSYYAIRNLTNFLEVQEANQNLDPFVYPVDYIYDEGRHSQAHSLLNRTIIGLFSKLSTSYPLGFMNKLGPLGSFLDANFLLHPVSLRADNLHPVAQYGMNFFCYASVLIAWVAGTIVVVSFDLFLERPSAGMFQKEAVLAPVASVLQRALSGVLCTLLLAILFTAVYGIIGFSYHAGEVFVWLWLTCGTFFVLNALIAALLGTDRFTGVSTLVMVLQFTAAGAILPHELSTPFYYIGQAFPFFYSVRGLRTILFGSLEHKMGENAGVIIAWLIAGGAAAVFVRYRKLRQYANTISPMSEVGAHPV